MKNDDEFKNLFDKKTQDLLKQLYGPVKQKDDEPIAKPDPA